MLNRAKAHKNLKEMKKENFPSVESSEMTPNSATADTQTTQSELPMAETNENVQSKSSRPTVKQRKLDLEDYRAAFFTPVKLTKDTKHQVGISKATFQRVERIARLFGNPDTSVGSFVDHIINAHLDENKDNFENWFSLIGKSF